MGQGTAECVRANISIAVKAIVLHGYTIMPAALIIDRCNTIVETIIAG